MFCIITNNASKLPQKDFCHSKKVIYLPSCLGKDVTRSCVLRFIMIDRNTAVDIAWK